MALRNIKTEENPILRKKSREVEEFNDRLFGLLDDMKETLYKADGVGLAAPQVGVLKRVVVIDLRDNGAAGYTELINPVIIEASGEQTVNEACLSLPHKTGKTLRPMYVKVRAQNRRGEWFEIEGTELMARCLCHEIDHLNGILFTDQLAPGEQVEYLED